MIASPRQSEENEFAIAVYRSTVQSAVQIEGEKKNAYFLRTESVQAAMEILEVPTDMRGEVLRRALILQDIGNELRRPRPKPKK